MRVVWEIFKGDLKNATKSVVGLVFGGPVFFSLLAMAIYQNYCSRMANKPE